MSTPDLFDQSAASAFDYLRNYLAGRAIGITRDRALLHELVKCLFCKTFLVSKKVTGNSRSIAEVYRKAFQKLKLQSPRIFAADKKIELDDEAIAVVDSTLSGINLSDPHEDPLSDLYQTFVASDVRGHEGQFFTPTEAVKWLVEAVDPRPREKIIDPACGSGSFLSYTARHIRAAGASEEVVCETVFGIEKDRYLADLANTHIALSALAFNNVVCADSIERKTDGGKAIPWKMDAEFDVVLTNPPFGAKIRTGTDFSKQSFELAFKWQRLKGSNTYEKSKVLATNATPQILFLELCLKLLKPGGRLGIVVPESMVANTNSGHVVQHLLNQSRLLAVIGMPEDLFKTSGKGGTHTKTCLIVAERRNPKSKKSVAPKVFMAEAKRCGHDSRGNPIPHNDLPNILETFNSLPKMPTNGSIGYLVPPEQLDNLILSPRYHDPSPLAAVSVLIKTHELKSFGQLVNDGVVEYSTGVEIGKLAYGTGEIPFVRTSDISSWEIKIDPKHGVSEEIYKRYAKKLDVREGDILMVRDGTYLIGTCGYVSKYDEKILYQSHIFKIRVKRPEVLNPFLLLAALSSKPVIAQIQAKRFTQDIIDTLGNRILELVLPIPRAVVWQKRIESMVRKSILERIEARELARQAKDLIICDDLQQPG